MSWFINLLHGKSRIMKLKEFQEIVESAKKNHINKETIYGFFVKCKINRKNIVKMWNLCDRNITNFMFCLWKEEAGSITKEEIIESIDTDNAEFFRRN
jgi:hypothetical protein